MPDFWTICGILASFFVFLGLVNAFASWAIRKRVASGSSLDDINTEYEIRKSIFAIVGGISVLFGAIYSVHEFGLKVRGEDRQALYGALSQLIEVDGKRPEISAAALLQLERLGRLSDTERPALVQIVAAYLNERATHAPEQSEKRQAKKDKGVVEPNSSRPDIQMGLYVLSRLLNGDPELGKFVKLERVNFGNVHIRNLKLVNVTLIDTNFRKAVIPNADFSLSTLLLVDFDSSLLEQAKFKNAKLHRTDFQGATLSAGVLCAAKERKDLKLDRLVQEDVSKCKKGVEN